MIILDHQKCDAAYGMKAFFQMLDEDPVKILLFGGACPSVTDPIAKTSKFFHLIQLSYADTFTATTANFFRIVPSEGSFNPARVKLLKFFNWTKVGTIYQNLPRYSLPHSKLLTDLDNADIEIVASQSIADELKPEMYLQDLKAKDVRIIVGNFGEEYGRKIFCQAYKEGIYGRRYQWIITGIYDENWWQLNDDEIDLLGCTEEQLLEAINGYISTDILPLSKNTQTYYGFETSLYKSEYDRLRLREYSRFHGYAYDGIWTIALAIQTVDKKLRQINSPLTIEDFHYRDPFWAQLFREALNETDFIGVTDHVSFDKNERRGIVLLQQFQSKKFSMTDIAQYYTYNDELIFDDQNQIDWRGGNSPPVDRNTVVIKPSRISMTLFIVISVFAIIGIIIAFVFLAMNIKYRNQRYIKMSSPYLNNLIIIGCILTYTSVILLGLNSGLTNENNFPYICASRAWVLMTGFTLAFGSMFSKTWRVHAIFTDIKLNKKLIKDYKLFMVVGVLVFIDVVTLTTWQIVDPFFRVTSQGKPEPSPQNEDILVIPEMEYCQSKRMTIFLGSIYVYKGLLMAFGIFLAWETRHVSIPALNDSKYIGMSVYNVVIMCVIGAGVSFVLRDQQDAAFVIISAFIIFCSTATLCLVFVPKLIELKRNPNAGDRRVRATLKPFKKSHRDSEDIEIHTKIKLANEENFRLRQRLKEKSYELEALTFRLRALEESMEKEMTNITTSSSAAKTIIQPKIPPPPSSSLSLSPTTTTTAGKSVILASNSVNNLGMARSSSSYANNIIPNTTNEIIVEENDLKQIDNCDQRKLSVASLKVLSKSASSSAAAAAKRQKLNIIKTPLGHFEIQEETTSTSPTEIIVNSTSILSLSSEAAQLTVKNSQQSTNEPPISSNISSNGEQNNSPQNGNDGISDQSATGSTKSSDEMSFTFPTYHPTHHHHHSKRITGNGIGGGDSNLFSPNGSFNEQCSLSNGSDETSDDTSYAKAIKQTMESQLKLATLTEISSNTTINNDNDENENENNKPEMMIENNQQHCHNIDEKKNMFDNNNNNIDLGNNNNDNLKRTFQQRRTQSFGGFLPTTTTTGNIMINTHEDYKTSSSSSTICHKTNIQI
ncbi:Gamma-aminobutyric acid type B receptor subunit 2 [Dermatophagoides pteronyssinus]|uniref:Gamma-aminobutyric acid type B receptor subunit 2 n=1 Tax=Dermatophagoides pteronyssinus TaxID=6956 RepID=A0ABQ8J1Y6_DERPT|nr:Gamma-aminobutyric acid type B receptor subunit 2 [Dermatophagoides pteronyssinus]